MPNNDSHQHVVKTTAQWDERAVEYWVVPRGCLCVELTPEGKTKLKVGEGNKYFKQLPYICDHGDLTNYYTKEEVDNLFDNLNRMAIMSTDVYDSADDLPSNDNKLGDVRFVKSSTTTDPDLYVWIGDRWIDVNSSDIDPSDFVTKPEFNAVKDKVDEIYPKAHTHANKDILDGITQADRDKFDDLHNYDDTELRRMIQETGHTHPNKSLLDTITQSSLWSASDRTKFDGLHNYNDTEVKVRLVAVEEKAHTHANKTVLDGITQEKLDAIDELAATYVIVTRDIADLKTKSHTHANKDLLDGTTASFTVEQQNELYRLSQISTFIGAGPTWNGVFGYVPAPEAGQQTYYLRADGTWAKVKSGGDKYKAGEGIYILSGETTSDSFPFKVYSRAGHLEQYIIYGNTGGVGDAMIGGVYGVNITVTDEHGNASNTSIILPEKISLGDYIDYGKQVFVHMRTNVSSLISSVDPSYNWRWAIRPNGSIQYTDIGAYGSNPQVTTLIELEPGITYELYHQCDYSSFANYMNLNVYDTEQNRTRTIHFYDPVGNVPTIIALASNEKYIRLTYEHAGRYPYTLIRVKAVETPITLPQIPLFPNSINTINVTNTIKPAEIYVEVAEPSEDDPDDPMSDFTGIIYNDGVLDITQEDPTNLSELTVHFRDDVDKTITIPSASVMEGATDQTDGEEGLVPAPLAGDENKFLRGDGTWAIPSGSVTYAAGDGITFTHPGMTDLGFDFDAFVTTITSMNNGTKTVDLEHEVLTLTATGDDCYTKPYNTSVQDVYTFPIVAGHVYRLTWDSSNPSVSGRVFAFENVSETNLHWIDQSVQDYLEFTAVTSGTINFRFGVKDSGNTISYSNIHFYEIDDLDPNTTIINADIAKGLEFDSLDKLQVSLGDGLHFDSNDAIELDSNLYYPGQGIEFGGETLIPTEFNQSAFINVIGASNGTISKTAALDAFTLTATNNDCFTDHYDGWGGYYITAEPNTKYRVSWESRNGTSGNMFVFEVSGTTYTGVMYIVNNANTNVNIFTTSNTCNKLSLRFGVANTGDSETYSNITFDKVVPLSNVITAKLGNGLQFDSNGAIEATATAYTAGTGIDIGGSIIYNKERGIPSDIYRQVEYITSNGNGYILTNIIPAGNTAFVARYITPSDDTTTQAIFGSNTIVSGQNRNSTVLYGIYDGASRAGYIMGNDSNSAVYNTPTRSGYVNDKLNTSFNNRDGNVNFYNDYSGLLDATHGSYSTSKGGNTQPIAILGVNTYDVTNDVHSIESLGHCSIRVLNVFRDDTYDQNKTHSLFPCYRLSDDVIGMYDIINEVFYPCNDSADFTLGPDYVDIVPVEGNVISAKLGKGLTVDSTYGNITNAGVIDITQDQLNPNTLTVKFANSQKDITIPGDSGNNNYRAGDGIEITTIYPPQQGFQVEDTDYYFDTNVQCTIGGRIFTKYTTDPALGVICHARINSGGGQSTVYSGPMFFGLSENAVKVHNDYSGGQTEGSMGTFEYKGYTWYISAHNYMNDGSTIIDGGIPRIDDLVFTFDGNGEIELGKMVIDLAGLITDPIDEFSAKLGDGLQFDANGEIEVGTQYVRVNTTDSFVLLHTKPADWDDNWHKYFELTYDEITTSPADWDPTKHYKYENDNYVLGTAGDTFVSTTWYDKHYVGLDPSTAVTFDSDVYYTGELQLIEDGETFDTAFEKVNEAIEHIERLEQEVQYLQDDRVGVRTTSTPEQIEFYNK